MKAIKATFMIIITFVLSINTIQANNTDEVIWEQETSLNERIYKAACDIREGRYQNVEDNLYSIIQDIEQINKSESYYIQRRATYITLARLYKKLGQIDKALLILREGYKQIHSFLLVAMEYELVSNYESSTSTDIDIIFKNKEIFDELEYRAILQLLYYNNSDDEIIKFDAQTTHGSTKREKFFLNYFQSRVLFRNKQYAALLKNLDGSVDQTLDSNDIKVLKVRYCLKAISEYELGYIDSAKLSYIKAITIAHLLDTYSYRLMREDVLTALDKIDSDFRSLINYNLKYLTKDVEGSIIGPEFNGQDISTLEKIKEEIESSNE